MTFQESVQVCFAKYADFSGRAPRSECWWFILFLLLASTAAMILGTKLGMLFNLATFLPVLAVIVRRLHDTGRSGWWLLLCLLPLVGTIVLIVFLTQASTERRTEPAP